MRNVGGIYAPGIFTNGRYSRRTSDDMFSTVPLVPDNQVEREIVGGFGLVSDERNFGGPHPGTASAVLGDGSTHSISNNAGFNVFQDLCMRSDGFVTNLEDF